AKSQVSRVMSETGSLRTAVETCLLEGRTTLTTCNVGWTYSNLLGSGEEEGSTLQEGLEITFGSGDTATTIEATFGNSAATAIQDETLTWSRDGDGSWSCDTSVEGKFKPAGCQGEAGGADA